jgi:hypothetical protein
MLVTARSFYASCSLTGLLEYVYSLTTTNLRNLKFIPILRVWCKPETIHAEHLLKWVCSGLRVYIWRHGPSRRLYSRGLRNWSDILTLIKSIMKVSIYPDGADYHQMSRVFRHLITIKKVSQSSPFMVFEKLTFYLNQSDRHFHSRRFIQSLMPNKLYYAVICNIECLKFIFSVAKYSPEQWVPTRRLVPNNQTITSQT